MLLRSGGDVATSSIGVVKIAGSSPEVKPNG
jgi:hypothetical protein